MYFQILKYILDWTIKRYISLLMRNKFGLSSFYRGAEDIVHYWASYYSAHSRIIRSRLKFTTRMDWRNILPGK